ncbi:unnamed protein product [Blepharisma stoltei]|uniref:RING-type domain-containing protein n=1 Tax=Blepharisma stoltei TaxID=1481888 RepID=A0AAU9K5B2_9CILI|nr:unnamed protein product [Blepharisma stoltei]
MWLLSFIFFVLSANAAYQVLTQDSQMEYLQFIVTNDMVSNDFIIQLSTKSQQIPLLLLVKEGAKPSFYFNNSADSYHTDTDYEDFQAWIQNSDNSYVTIKEDDLTLGSTFYIGIYSEILGISYSISKYSKVDSNACIPECIAANYSTCTEGACQCSGNSSGYDCGVTYTVINFDDNRTYFLAPNQWNLYIFDCRSTYGFTIDIEKYAGDPKFYFTPFYSDLYLPSMFFNWFYLTFGEARTRISKNKADNQWAWWTYSVFCHGESSCEFSIEIDDYSQTLSSKLIWWIAVIAIVSFLLCIVAPFAIKSIVRSRWAGTAQTNFERQTNPLTPEEMELLFPSVEWEKLGKNKDTCAICLEDFEDNAKVRKLSCDHVFHTGCIDEWAKSKAKCPLCKKILNCGENIIDPVLVVPGTNSQSENLIIEENQENEESKEEEKEKEDKEEEKENEESLQYGEGEKNYEEECLYENEEANENIKEIEFGGHEITIQGKKKDVKA